MSDRDRPDGKDNPPPESDVSQSPDQPADEAALEEAFFDPDREQWSASEGDAPADDGGLEGLADEPPVPGIYDEDLMDGEDELRRILGPQRALRHPILAAVVIVASVVFMAVLWADFRYFLRSDTPEELGLAKAALAAGRLQDNHYVTLSGMPVMQSIASNRTQKMGCGGVSAGKGPRTFWLILEGTGYRVIVRANRRVLEGQDKPTGAVRVRGSFTGRLRKLDSTEAADAVRRYYRRQSKRSPALRPSHRVPGKELLAKVGQTGATLTDLKGRRFRTHKDGLFEIFAAFPGEYEFDVHTDFKFAPLKVTVKAGAGAGSCGPASVSKDKLRPGRGGSVWFEVDGTGMDFGDLGEGDTVTAAAGVRPAQADSAAVDGAPRVIKVPPGTMVFNAKTRHCTAVCEHLGKRCRETCEAGEGVEIRPGKDGRVLAAVGGACGRPGEEHQVNLTLSPHTNLKRATAFVASLGHPFILVEDAVKRNNVVRYILRMPAKRAAKLAKQQGNRYNIADRQEVYRAKWRYLRRQGSDLIITRSLRSYPSAHQVVKGSGGKRLEAVPVGATVRLAGPRVLKADTVEILEIPTDAWLLVEGEKPSKMWARPVIPGVPIFFGLLMGFALFNLFSIVSYFRSRRA